MQKWTESPFGVLEAHFLSPSLLPSHSVSITHSFSPLSSCFRSSLHQHCSALSALAVTRSRCCSTNFSHPFIPAIRPFPKSTLSQRGEAFSHWLLLHGNFSLFCSSFCFFCKSFFLFTSLLFIPFLLFTIFFTFTVLGQFFYHTIFSFIHVKIARKYYNDRSFMYQFIRAEEMVSFILC